MKLFKTILLLLCISCTAIHLSASEEKRESITTPSITSKDFDELIEIYLNQINQAIITLDSVEDNGIFITLDSVEDYGIFINIHLDLIKKAEVTTKNTHTWMKYNNKGVLCAKNGKTTINFYSSDFSNKLTLRKIINTPPLDFYGYSIPGKKNSTADKKLLSQVSQAITSGLIKDSDTIIQNKSKLRSVNFDESPANDPNNKNMTHRYDVASPFDQTFKEDNSSLIVTSVKSPFFHGKKKGDEDYRPYNVCSHDSSKISSKEIGDALQGNAIHYQDDQGNTINGEKNHRSLLPLAHQLILAQEELNILEKDKITYNKGLTSIKTQRVTDKMHNEYYNKQREIESLENKMMMTHDKIHQEVLFNNA